MMNCLALRVEKEAEVIQFPDAGEDLTFIRVGYAVGHTPYVRDDFTRAEMARRNPLAVEVVAHGRLICKRCGRTYK